MFCDPLLGKKQIDAPHRLWLMRSRPFKTVGISMTSTAAPLGMTPRSWLDLGVLSFLWGLSFLFYDIALDGLSPLAVVFGRCGVAALFLLIMLRATGVRLPRDPKLWMALIVMGLLNNALPFFLIVNGQSQPGFHGGMSSIFNSTVPLFTVIIAQFFLADEKITVPKIAGILLGILGVTVMLARDAFTGQGSLLIGGSFVLMAAFSYGVAGVWARRFGGVPPMQIAAGQQISATAWLILPVFLIDKPWTYSASVPLGSWLAIAGLGIFATALAYVLFFRILRTAGATNVSLVTLLIPVWAILFNATIRQGTIAVWETITLAQWLGMALIALGLAVLNKWIPLPGQRR
jgi:drug/metabolite transporter (DMT)-like permease